MRESTNVSERATGKIPTTAVTNQLARAVQAMAPIRQGGQVLNPLAIGESSTGFVPVLVVRNGGTNGDTASYPAPLFDVWLDLEADTGTDDPDYSGIPLASSPSLIAKATMTGTGNYGQLWTKTTGDLLLFDVLIEYETWTCTTG